MEELFRLIRMPLLPIPLILWSAAWPALLIIVYLIVIPILLVAITTFRSIGLPFVFFYSALNNKAESFKEYVSKWKKLYENTMQLADSIPITETYKFILAWGADPKSSGGTGGIVSANVVAIVAVASIYSEEVRTTAIVLLVAFVALIIWVES